MPKQMRTAPRRRRVVAAAAAAVALLAPAPPSGAAGARPAHTPTPYDDRIAELQAEIGEASADEAAALAELGAVRSRRERLDAEIGALDGEIAAAAGRAAAAARDGERAAIRYLDLTARLDATERRLRRAQDAFDDTVAALYRAGGSAGRAYATLVLDTSAPHELFAGTRYLAAASRVRYATIESLSHLRDRTGRLREGAEEQRALAEAARQAAEEERGRLAGLRAEQDAHRDELAREERREERLVASIRARRDQFTQELAVLQAASNAIAAELQDRQGSQTRTGFRVLRPVPGAITSGFGPRVHPILGTTRLHAGVDMAGGYGTPIRAGASGTVVWADWRSGYGNTVIIDHHNQYATLYAHMSSFSVSYGDEVSAGEQVGAVGMTGLATGPHLHFEVRLLGVPQNPVDYL